jgi:multimeric flavodoxin WrbA
MRVLAINGSPRKDRNTATILSSALDGAASQGAKTELVHLYDLDFKGCKSCLACKLKGGKSYCKCAQQDGLTPVLEKIPNVDAMILGSPIYFGSVTGEMRSFIERAAYPYFALEPLGASMSPKKIKIGLIATLQADENRVKEMGMDRLFAGTEMILGRIFGSAESLLVTGTDRWWSDDYTKYISSHEAVAKAKQHREEVFPVDCRKAFDMGVRLSKK